jgi:hypothetical protein
VRRKLDVRSCGEILSSSSTRDFAHHEGSEFHVHFTNPSLVFDHECGQRRDLKTLDIERDLKAGQIKQRLTLKPPSHHSVILLELACSLCYDES